MIELYVGAKHIQLAEIKKLSLPKYLSTDTELIKIVNLLLSSCVEQTVGGE